MIELLLHNPLLLLFVVVGIGYPLGRVRVAGSSLGVAAVLFVGIGIGALHPDLKLPEIIYLLGLVLFVYTIGLSSGPSFFRSFGPRGLKSNLLVLGMLALGLGLTLAAQRLLGLRPTLAGGLFAGSLTNTPALAAELEFLKLRAPHDTQALADPVVGYSISYPLGVIGVLLAIGLTQLLWKVDYSAEAERTPEPGSAHQPLEARVVKVLRAPEEPLGVLMQRLGWDVIFGRHQRGGHLSIADLSTRLQPGDLVTVVGPARELDEVAAGLGEVSQEPLAHDRSVLDYRRIFVSNPEVFGRRLAELNLPGRFGAVATRLRRGDVDMLAQEDTVLEPGDRLRVLTRRDRLDEVSRFLGDSYRAISEIDILSFSLGLALGLLLGAVPIPLPGGVDLKLGFAGGPLVVALVLGWLGRTGRFVWGLPYSANLTLRQIGLVMFLAGVGTRSGHAFFSTLTQGGGLSLLVAGGVITFTVSLATLVLGHKVLGIPMSVLTGLLGGLQTQPAVLGFALEQTKNDLPNVGYTTVYPLATVAKIILAQVLLAMLL
ncbi:transporter [Archangium sp. Cb G35]|uniref:aspartate:alanine exchanger family transporter n=1 Tax=Archangium sp. Cb G35 TaxID=1920190 RepID=UPI0009362E81|nr:aspartate:alanine exchanger family transporter [Archangium sp. Cb G35]OJT18003.1 transporter [Archangium sp. Cb G35]